MQISSLVTSRSASLANADWIKIFVPLADGVKILWPHQGDDFVGFAFELGIGRWGRCRHGDDDAGWLLQSHRPHGGAHRGTRGDVVVNQDDDFTAYLE